MKDQTYKSNFNQRMYDKYHKEKPTPTNSKWWDNVGDKKLTNDEKLVCLKTEKDNQLSKMVNYWSMHNLFEKKYHLTLNLEKQFIDEIIGNTNSSDLSYNVYKSCIDSFSNKIAKTRPKATFLTKDGTMEEKRVARNLDVWVESKMKKANVQDSMHQAFRSAAIGFYGSVKVFRDKDGKFKTYMVDPVNFFCKDPDVKSYRKDEMGEREKYRLYQLLEKYPKKRKKLLDCYGSDDLDKIIEVFEMYKSKKARAVFTDHMILEFEKWKHSCPYRVFVWKKKLRGMIGEGICEELFDYQDRLIYILEKISKSMGRLANTRIYISKNSGINDGDITGNGDDIVEYNEASKPPIIEMPPIISRDYFFHLEDVWAKAHQQIGAGENYRTGDVNKQLRSGVAVRAAKDQSSERFSNVTERYEKFAVDIAKLICELASSSDLPSGLKGVNLYEQVKQLSVYPSNLLPETPAGQLATIMDLGKLGIIDTEELLYQIDAPDVKSFLSSKMARREAIDMAIERAMDYGEDFVVDEVFGLDLILDRLRNYYAMLSKENHQKQHDEKLAILLKAISGVAQKVQEQQQAQFLLSQGGGQPGGQPPQSPINN